MRTLPAVVIFFNDWEVFPNGINAGGGEAATMALARAIKALGFRVIACANLPAGECTYDGIEFWNFGPSYSLQSIAQRLEREVPTYHCIAATLVHPFLHLQEQPNCLSRILINHAPSATSSGLEPATVLRVIDYMLCVSHMQRSVVLSRKTGGEKIKVVKNGFDPEIFTYAGPEQRDWNQLVFIGRVEAPKGIHVLLQVFGELKGEFPDLKLSVFGDESYWPEFTARRDEFMQKLPGLRFHGKVPQIELAAHLRKAGLLVFPSQSFETAGLAVLDAQACGCPVVATAVGGVPEYVVENDVGVLVNDLGPATLKDAIATLLRDRSRLMQMSQAAKMLGRQRPWRVVAEEVMSWAERAANGRAGRSLQELPDGVLQIKQPQRTPVYEVLQAHDLIVKSSEFSSSDLQQALAVLGQEAWPHLIEGLRKEASGEIDHAIDSYRRAAERSVDSDWQAFFRLAVVHAERQELPIACRYAEQVIQRSPAFPYKSDLERLISLARGV